MLVACSSDDRSTSSTTGSVLQPPATLPVSAPGSGSIAVGATVSGLTVTSCSPEGTLADETGARISFALTGEGETESGIAFTVSVRRRETPGKATTYDDEVLYQDTARIYQAQRVEADGVVTDVRDEDADRPLLSFADGHVVAKGKMGPPGDDGTLGTVDLLLDATCRAA
jgi:hypothetical protein